MEQRQQNRSRTPEYHRDRRRTIQGLLSQAWHGIKVRCEGRRPPEKVKIFKGLSYAGRDEFLRWARNDPGFVLCYRQWARSGYDKKLTPTVTRVDNTKGYTLDNIEFMSHSCNAVYVRSVFYRADQLNTIRRLVGATK